MTQPASPQAAPHSRGPSAGPSIAAALATTTTIQILSTVTALALTGIAPLVAPDFGLAPHYVGYQISVIYAAGMMASAFAGTLIQHRGPVQVEQLALGCFGTALLLLASANPWVAVLASIVIGIGYGVQNPASAQILGAVTPPHRRSLIFSIKQAGVPIGGVLASLLLPAMAPRLGWQMSLTLLAIPCFAMIGVLALKGGPPRPTRPPSVALWPNFVYEQRLVWGSAALRSLAVLGMLYSSLQLSLSAFAVIMLVDHGWPLVQAGLVAGALQACGALGRVSWGGLGDRFGGFAVLALIGAVSMGCMIALWQLDALPIWVQIAVLCLFGFCMSGWNGVVMAECTHHCAPEDAGRVIGGSLVYTFLGVMIGPAAMATIYAWCGDYGTSFLLVSWVAALGAVIAARAAIKG
ncbi:arabinose ABC transporter permease [Novosphingobium barchaimii LL02]|uniref:Arabinose ABC transporter permease n=1 Tax=Novosphingobium barchaimii LL02 TaxID=1114963 RepID=A0A0J7XHK7_9SPHN|nr:MFS transporter [Novosphingobium barchaimii]KMS51139.1 arabinose ABC transporter permease [Novosphingobium barchaimii LL02]